MENEVKTKKKKSIFKRWWFWVIIAVVVIGIIGGLGGNNETPIDTDTGSTLTQNSNELSQDDGTANKEPSTNKNESLSFTLTAGKAGQYGKMISYNKGTEFEENFYAYYIPAGTYTVTNKGKYMSQVNVYSNSIHITSEGWEEPAETFDVKLIDVNKSDTITIEEGQHIEIAEPSTFEFKKQ
ncbi:MAG: hypothetical protein J6B86_04425 [Clostridia bacterium]|nr:hypothetical protein [Clostridia bacterium]MBO5408743.1 hypothetical protein [Clostridia bacterium]